jgi:hypothetical protein
MRLIVRRVYIAPQADLNNACGAPVAAVQNQMLVNIPNPNLSSNLSASFDPSAYDDNASFYLQPSDEGRVTLRVWCPKGDATCQAAVAQARSLVAARIEAEAPNNCPAGSPQANCQVNGFRPDDIYDTVPPVTSCSITADAATRDCSQGPFYVKGSALVTLTPTDGVGVLSTSYSLDGATFTGTTFTVSGEGQHLFSFGSTDLSHNTETLRAVSVQVDTTAPVVAGFTFPGATVPGQWVSAPSVTGTINVTDGSPVTVACGDSLTGGTTVSGLSITVTGDGSHVLTCTIRDGAGNTTTAGTTVNLDATSPTVTPASAVVTAEASGASGTTVNYTVAATDLLSGAVVSCTPPSGSTFVLGNTLVTCTATDGAGNTSTATFNVMVKDTTAPVVTVAGSLSAEATSAAGAVVNFSASAVDAVDGALVASCVPASGSVFPVGSTTVTCTAIDGAGNTGSASFTVTVGDTTKPVLTVPGPITAEATGSSGAAVTFSASATDIVSGSLAAACLPASGSTFAIGATTVTCSAIDGAGNTGSASFTVTVGDTTKPVVTVPGPITAEATGSSGAAVTFSASATDIVSGSLAAACLPASGSTFAIGTTSVTCTATDANNNTGSASFTVTVGDTTKPVVTVPGPITAEATGSAGAAVTFSASATDIVSGSLAASCAPASGSTFVIGTTSVTCSATDANNNSGSASFAVIVRDTTAPAVTVPGPIVAEATGANGASVTFSASAMDIVGGSATASCAPASGSIFRLGTTPVLCSAADGSGNTGSASFTVTVRDTTAPLLTLPAPITKAATSSSGAAVSFTASASDLVSGAVAPVCSPASGSTFAVGTATVTCTATDAAGNAASGTFTVTVQQQQYGFINVKNLPPPAGTKVNLGSSVPLSWRWTLGGVAVATADALPLITITGPTGVTTTFTPESPGNSTFQYTSSSFTWQFNWQTKGLVVGTYSVSVTIRKTGQITSGGQITLK